MQQFAALLRKQDKQPVRYLVVDDSVFARKNLARMIEVFGGPTCRRGRRRMHGDHRIRPEQAGYRAHGHHHAADGRDRGRRWEDRDRFILPKGHGVPALYAVLAEAGYLDPKLLGTLRRLGSPLLG
jgi:hypothetical protein